ncbi:MAG: 3' terminal RNA ribose 2'-O-methyltransferase Hen1 [Thalassobius sp.]|nr:3' terminal RNA ribose 2'-O-methyltransferase Hen1 [Thalassovita sp.]
MLLNITTTHYPATDLGYLLHKHPDRFQSVSLAVGKVHIFYPECTEEKATVSILLDIDSVDMVKKAKVKGNEGFALGHYVNDRPYVVSSIMSVALSKAFSSAMNGKCKDKPELIDQKLPIEVEIPTLPAPAGGETLIRNLFEPLGYDVEVERHQLDEKFKEWGDSKYYSVVLKNMVTVKDLLSHLYVLIPALDNDKHYFVSEDEVEKLLKRGEGWLHAHPKKDNITRRYLLNLKSLTREAFSRINEEEGNAESEDEEVNAELKKKKETLHQKRLNLVVEKLLETPAARILDLGCGEGKLIKLLMKHNQFSEIHGMDVSYRELIKAKQNLHFDELAPRLQEKLNLFQGSLTYRDQRLAGFDAAAVVEVIEHMDLNRLKAFERVLFEFAKPNVVVLTTPNKEYNAMFEGMSDDAMRHDDHRFEWTREEFKNWVEKIAENYAYSFEIFPVGDEEVNVGAPSQMVVFKNGN